MAPREVPKTSESSGKREQTQDPVEPEPGEDDEEQSDCTKATLKVKVLRSRKLKRVLCLECGKEFADMLLSLLIMPVGAILKYLDEGGLVKSHDNGLFNLHSSLKQLEESAFCVERKTLIDPRISRDYSSDILRLKAAAKEECLNPGCRNETEADGQICDDCEVETWYGCPNLSMEKEDRQSCYHGHGSFSYIVCPAQTEVSKLLQCLDHFNSQSYGSGRKCPSCQMMVTRRAFVIQRQAVQISPEQKTKSSSSGNGATGTLGFVEKNITFMVKEDLSITQSSAISALALLQSMKCDFADLDTKEIDVGQKEGLLLVRAAMVSKTPLTDIFEPFFR